MAVYSRTTTDITDNEKPEISNCITLKFKIVNPTHGCVPEIKICSDNINIHPSGKSFNFNNSVSFTMPPPCNYTGEIPASATLTLQPKERWGEGFTPNAFWASGHALDIDIPITLFGNPSTTQTSSATIRNDISVANIWLMPKISEWHIYGNSDQGRFAIKKPDNNIDIFYLDALTQNTRDKNFFRILGSKEYELKDHLGNVRVAITDFKQPATLTQTRGTQPYIVDERSVNDYYPYGMLIPERSWSSTDYRYGYGGHELDNEVKGTGNHLSFGDFGLDPRVGRRWNPDPVVQPGVSGYVIFNNNPNYFVDIDGYKATPFPYRIGSLKYYLWRKKDFEKRNPGKRAPNYYADYGDKYIKRFTYETNKQLSAEGQAWLKLARANLQKLMEAELAKDKNENLELNGEKFKKMAFDTHVDAYWEAGLKNLSTLDLVAVVLTPDFKDLMSKEGIEQAQKIVGKLVDYWTNNPIEGAERLAELFANKQKIESMVIDKIKRETFDPDKAIKVFNKIIELIPTIKIDPRIKIDVPKTSKKQ